ncbi:ABC transporter substrate-binding protein [Intrasporangium sp. DVR]|uniref:ABC transporter substrate-binding protein n=1 Tax=Intrasporangium sp. DVR TaxID=3127867 RepID=UPI00313A5F4B
MRRFPLLAVTGMVAAGLTLSACGSDTLEPRSPNQSAPQASTPASTGSADPALAEKVPDKIKTAGKIVVGTDASYAPNEFIGNDGKTVEGMDVDLFNAVAAKLGVTAEYQNAGFDTIILGVTGGKYDVGVSSFTINDDRKKEVNMVSYFNAGTQWVAKTGNPKKVDPNNACGLTIGVQKGTVQETDDLPLKQKACTDAGKPEMTLVVQEKQDQVTADVVSGKTDAMLADSPIGLYAVKQTNGQLEAVGDIYDAAPYGFVVPKDQTEFAQAIADALKALKADGTYDAVLKQWGNESGGITDFAVNP